jgi:methyl-accepting chemotaxis protein
MASSDMQKVGNSVGRFFTIGRRLWLAAGFLILLSVAVGYVSLTTSDNYRRDAETVAGLAKRTITVFETDLLIYKLVRAEKDYVLTADRKFLDERNEFSTNVDQNLNALIDSSVSNESKRLLDELRIRKTEYDRNFQNAVTIFNGLSLTPGERRALQQLTEPTDVDLLRLRVVEDGFERVRQLSLSNTEILLAAESNLISKIVDIDTTDIEQTLIQAQTNSQQVRYISFAAMAAALLVGAFISYFTIGSTTSVLRDTVERLARLSSILRDSVIQATEVANRNATTAGQLAASSTQQSQQAEQISTTISQTARAISATATLANEGSESVSSVNALAQKGGEGAQQAAEGLQKIRDIVNLAVERIRNLASGSQEVGALAGEVTSIADQTNILALNAAIEAARAGEAGRGFAVVADEVRRLAENSRKFADQITQLITSVMNQAQETAQTTSSGADDISESTQTINETLSSFQQITDAVADANAKIQEIASSVAQQAESAEQISKTTTSIAQGIEQNASGSKSLADAVDQQRVVISVIQKSIEEAELLLVDSRALVGLRGEVAMEVENLTANEASDGQDDQQRDEQA